MFVHLSLGGKHLFFSVMYISGNTGLYKSLIYCIKIKFEKDNACVCFCGHSFANEGEKYYLHN